MIWQKVNAFVDDIIKTSEKSANNPTFNDNQQTFYSKITENATNIKVMISPHPNKQEYDDDIEPIEWWKCIT